MNKSEEILELLKFFDVKETHDHFEMEVEHEGQKIDLQFTVLHKGEAPMKNPERASGEHGTLPDLEFLRAYDKDGHDVELPKDKIEKWTSDAEQKYFDELHG